MRWEGSTGRLARCVAGLVLGALAAVMVIGPAITQQKQPPGLPNSRLFVVMPPGGKAGTSFEVICSGQDIDESQALVFSHPGIKADLVESAAVIDPKAKQVKGGPTPSVNSKFKVTIAADVPPGIYDIRLASKWGVSNPRAFVVGDQNEMLETEPNNDVEQANKVPLNSTVNGAITAPTDVDYFVFGGKKGQRVVVSCLSSSIDSRLNATLELYDTTGRQVAYNRNYHGLDALTDLTLPADGDYIVRLYQFTHTVGNAEYFYRLTITTAPWIDAVFPSVVEPGKPTPVSVYGRNLPDGKPDPEAVVDGRVLEKAVVTVNPPKDPLALQRLDFNGFVPPYAATLNGFEVRVKNPAGSSNGYPLTYATAPVVLDAGNNDRMEQPQKVPVPCEIAGRIEKRRDRDWYAFELKKDQTISIDVMGDRIGSPADMSFVVVNEAGKQTVLEQDDVQDTLSPFKFNTRSADPPRTAFKAPADGTYLLLVSSQDADTQAGPRFPYRVTLAPPQPDFQLFLMADDPQLPDACVVRQGGNQYYEVLVRRQDGFNGEVTLTAAGLPPGVTCQPQTVGPGLSVGTLVISAAPDAPPWTGAIQVKGTARINNQEVIREARSASVTWPLPQPNIIAQARLDRSIVLAVREQAPFGLIANVEKATIFQGEKTNVSLKLVRQWPDFKAAVQAAPMAPLSAQPKGGPANLPTINNNAPVQIAADKSDATAVLESKANTPPGTYSFALRTQAPVSFSKDPASPNKTTLTYSATSTPITVTILPKAVANLSAAPAKAAVKAGGQSDIVVKVARLFDFDGPFKVQLVVPDNVKGLSADEVTIPAGQDEAKLVVKATTEATPANYELLVRASARYRDVDTTQETKIVITIQK
jgi:hypothetical protein